MEHHPNVDAYLATSELWPKEIAALRPVLRKAGLAEEVKWGKPCYTHGGKNVLILQEFKDFLAVMFFKGALLADPEGILEEQGQNTRSARRICIRSVAEAKRLSPTIVAYVEEAVAVEEAGLDVGPAPEPELADELQARLEADDVFRAAFESLTPGRRRGYNLYVAGTKQAATRRARVEKIAPRVLAGKGLHDR